MQNQDPRNPEEKRICADCINEEYLSDEIRNSGDALPCSYCSGNGTPSWALSDLADRVHTAIQEHYQRTSDQPSAFDLAMSHAGLDHGTWYREGSPIQETIEELAEVSGEVAEDIRAVLDSWDLETDDSHHFEDETPYDAEAHYEEKGIDPQEWEDQWQEFEFALTEESRFFNHGAADILSSVFANIHTLPAVKGLEIIQEAGPGTSHTHIYRARAFQSTEDLLEAIKRPDLLLGAPPPKMATAGRMNARGISVFYGASNPDIALAEVRPPVGSKVAMAYFEIIEPLKLLNLINLEQLDFIKGSLFDPSYGKELERASFLRTLGNRLARPVMPSDQDIDYIATQAVADYLANYSSPTFDGIIFKSVQGTDDGYNIVLFHRAARVETIALPKGAEIDSGLSSSSEEELGDHYSVVEWVPEEKGTDTARKDPIAFSSTFLKFTELPDNFDQRANTLRVDTSKIDIHSVKAAKFETRKRPVERMRIANKDLRNGDF